MRGGAVGTVSFRAEYGWKFLQRKRDKRVDYGVFLMSEDFVLRTYADVVYKVAVRNTQSLADAEDVFSDTFLAYYSKKPKFESEEHRRAWLLRVAINLARNTHRARKRTAELKENLISDDGMLEQTELSCNLEEALARLQPDYREVICLFYLQELSTREIAQILERNESTVRTQLLRAREQLRRFLQ